LRFSADAVFAKVSLSRGFVGKGARVYRPTRAASRGYGPRAGAGAVRRGGGRRSTSGAGAARVLRPCGSGGRVRGAPYSGAAVRGASFAGPWDSASREPHAPRGRAACGPEMQGSRRVIHRHVIWGRRGGGLATPLWISPGIGGVKLARSRRNSAAADRTGACRRGEFRVAQPHSHRVIHELSPKAVESRDRGWSGRFSLDLRFPSLRPRARPSRRASPRRVGPLGAPARAPRG
jgi:hypothetical protein